MIPVFGQPTKVDKAWGYELIIHNSEKYCGKILHFFSGKKFSLHFHVKKTETWFVSSGRFKMTFLDTDKAVPHPIEIGPGQVVHIEPGVPHQLEALENSAVFEVSTHHEDSDSYRIIPGDSQA